jgi:organic hydroperoxide reductase OsmC/OhrA
MKVKSKGTTLSLAVAGVAMPISQMLTMDKDDVSTETAETDTLDNTNPGIPYTATGRSEGGNFSGDIFLDPALTCHQLLFNLVTNPAQHNTDGSPKEAIYTLTFNNVAATAWTFTGAGISIAGPKVDLKEFLKATIKIKLDGLPTYPVGSATWTG